MSSIAYNQDLAPEVISRALAAQADRILPPGLLGRLFNAQHAPKQDEAVFIPWPQPPNNPPCPTPSGNPCGQWAKLLAKPLQAVMKWQTPELPPTPKLAAQLADKTKRPLRVRRRITPAGFPPPTKAHCAFLLSQFRFLEARDACPTGLLFRVNYDFFGIPTGIREPREENDLTVEAVITILNNILDHPPSRLNSVRAQ